MAFKVQTNLDLCNFELQNFCVQSYTNTNNVEPTLARMLFVNGNENSDFSDRLVIYNSTGWKGLAYMDDLTTFKDEDFEALKEKVELLSGDVDTDAIINNMKDVEAFLAGFTESQTLMDLLNDKLSKREGGVVGIGNQDVPFSINGISTNIALGLQASGTTKAYLNWHTTWGICLVDGDNTNYRLGIRPDKTPYFTDSKDIHTFYTLLHSGNFESLIGDTYLKTTGGTISGALTFEVYNAVTTTEGINFGQYAHIGASENVFGLYSQNYIALRPFGKIAGGEGLEIKDDVVLFNNNFLLHSGNVGDYALKIDGSNEMQGNLSMGSNGILFTITAGDNRGQLGAINNDIRWYNGTEWNVLGYKSDIDKVRAIAESALAKDSFDRIYADAIDSNVVSATTMYADTFTGNATSATKLQTARTIWGQSFDGTGNVSGDLSLGDSRIFWRSNRNAYYIGTSFTISEDAPNLDYGGFAGHRFLIRGNVAAMTITEEGRIVVGTNGSVDGDRLYSRGRINILSLCDNPTLGNMPENGLVMTDNQSTLGLAQWVSNGTGVGNIQAMSFDGTATAYALNLNPLGGEVNVGSGGLNVGGSLSVASTIYLKRASQNYIWANTAGGVINMGVQDAGDAGPANSSLTILSTAVLPGLRNNAVSLGNRNYRWSNVYSTLGDFSSRVLIGGAEDDANYALNVKGVMNASAIKTPTIYIECAEDGTYGANGGEINRFNGTIHMQYASQKDITLCYGGGNVGIGVRYPQHKLDVLGDSYFDGTVYIPTGQTLQFGDATNGYVTAEYDSEAKALKFDGNIYATGTVASGNVGDIGSGGGSGSASVRDFSITPTSSKPYILNHELNTWNVIVQIFEKDVNGESWNMVLTDVEITDENNVTVTFGGTITTDYRVHIIGGDA